MTHRGPFQPLPFCDSVKCFSRTLGRGFNAWSAFLLASFCWVGESLARSHQRDVLQSKLLSSAIAGQLTEGSHPRKQRLEQRGRATISMRNSSTLCRENPAPSSSVQVRALVAQSLRALFRPLSCLQPMLTVQTHQQRAFSAGGIQPAFQALKKGIRKWQYVMKVTYSLHCLHNSLGGILFTSPFSI